jgi:kynurenine formamidase
VSATDREEAYIAWLEQVAEDSPFGRRDRRGTANYIDDAARLRAAEAIRTGSVVALARPLQVGAEPPYNPELLAVELTRRDRTTGPRGGSLAGGAVTIALDTQTIAAHGQHITHLDGLNHFGRRGTWYSGFPIGEADGSEIADLADHKLFTRGVVVDVPAIRGTEWVDASAPVTGDDIDASLAASGISFQAGDALLLYMGRDRYEAAGHRMDPGSGAPTPGAGVEAARWIAEHRVSILCWDFHDGITPSEPSFPIHLLIWGIGLLLIDNCNLRPAVDAAARNGSAIGGLVVAPPPIPRATHCLVGPLFIQ